MDNRLSEQYSMYISMLREYRMDASSRLAYGLCKKYGINTKGMNPQEAWAALKEKTGKTAADFYSKSGEKGHAKIKFATADMKHFARGLVKAKQAQDPKDAWRVDADIKGNHPNAKLHMTDGGSTIALDNGNIVGVCKKPGDMITGSGLLAYAVKNGGNRLDSYEGNHGFYVKQGFEPVSWCKWDGQFAPDDWSADRDKEEDIIFYKYVGKGNVKNTDLDVFKRTVKASADYDEAEHMRDKEIKK